MNQATSLNIIHIHGHDAGRFFSPYGYAVNTPNVQRLADRGVTFRNAFAAAPTSSPSRAALMTGQYPHVCGMHGLASSRWGYYLNDYSKHLASFLHRQGYETAVAGVMHEGRRDFADLSELKYERWLNHDANGYPLSHTSTLGAALSYLSRPPTDQPFFLSVGFGEPHRDNSSRGRRHGYDADMPFVEDIDGRYHRPPAPVPDTPLTRRDWASFCQGVERLDQKMGAVIDEVDRAGLADNTLIIATIDHGIAWPHGKGNLTDMGLGVMLVMRGPTGSGFEGGKVVDALVSQMDIYPMVCDLIGVDRPDHLQGVSMLPLITGERESIRDHVFGEQGYHGEADPQRSVRTERYRYIRRKPIEHIRIVDPGPTNDWMRSLGYRDWPAGEELLYDLWFDPCETCNRIDDPALAEVREDLRGRLDRWLEDTSDPFRDDTIPPPPAWAAKSQSE